MNLTHATVTGASGFIGSHLVERLLSGGTEVTAFVRPNSSKSIGRLAYIDPALHSGLTVKFVDILDCTAVKAALGPYPLIHLAAQIDVPHSFQSPSLYLQTNLLGTQNLFEASLQSQVPRIVVVSSSEVYGGAGSTPISETAPLCCRSPYAASKAAVEKLAEAYLCSYGLPAVIVRPFNTYGERQSDRAVIPSIVRQALQGGIVTLGNTAPVRDFVHVKDTANGLIQATTVGGIEGETFNLATGQGYTIRTVVDLVGKAIGRPLVISENPERIRSHRSEVWKLIGETAKSERVLNWVALTPLSTGIAKLSERMSEPFSPVGFLAASP